MSQILYTLAAGSDRYAHCALGLGRSLKLIGDSTKRVAVTDQKAFPWDRSFDQVLEPTHSREGVFFAKLDALERTDADQVLYVDSDCLAFKRLDAIFRYCKGKGFCVQGSRITEGDWYGSVQSHLERHNIDSMPMFNGGFIYYERTADGLGLLAEIKSLADNWRELGMSRDDDLAPDEPIISLAMAKTGLGHLIPETMDFTNSATGLIGKLTLDVKNNDCHFLCRRQDLRFVRPHIFHASRYRHFLKYWNQLRILEQLEAYETANLFGYMPFGHRLRRSVERRILKLRGKG